MERIVFELAQSARSTGKYGMYPTYERRLTQRAVLWIGLHCDVNCMFCYDKHADPLKKHWVPLDSAITAVERFRFVYHSKWVDLTGGETTLYAHIFDLIEHCAAIGLEPNCITHGLHLADIRNVQRFKNAGIHSFLVSIHGMGPVQDAIHGSPGKNATQTQLRALENLRSVGIPFRMNTTLIRNNKKQLVGLAKLAAEFGASTINFITFNPYFEWKERSAIPFQARHSEVIPYLKEALDVCTDHGVEANVRYMPLCQLKGYEQHLYTGFQLPYDPHEWDYNSWYDMSVESPDSDWYLEASRQQRERYSYEYGVPCRQCAVAGICDGFHPQYAKRWGFSEAQPYGGPLVNDPTIFIRRQLKFDYERVDAPCSSDSL